MAYAADIISDFFLSKGTLINNAKLQCLLYLAQREFLKATGRPCIEEPFLAKKAGPIVESIYYKYCFYGAMPIRITNRDVIQKNIQNISPEDDARLSTVWAQYGHMDPLDLMAMVTMSRAYKKVRQGILSNEQLSPIISIRSILIDDLSDDTARKVTELAEEILKNHNGEVVTPFTAVCIAKLAIGE